MYGPKIDAVAKNVIVKVMKLRRQGQLGQGIAALKASKEMEVTESGIWIS